MRAAWGVVGAWVWWASSAAMAQAPPEAPGAPSAPAQAQVPAPQGAGGAVSEPAVAVGEPEPAEDGVLEPGWVPAGVALVPGLVVHGLGHMTGGDTEAGLELLFWEGIGFGMMATGAVPLVLTGASRQVITPALTTFLMGTGIFFQSWMADVFGAATGGLATGPMGRLPGWWVEVGHRAIYDPQFEYRNLAVVGAEGWVGEFRLSPRAWVALDADNQRLRAEGAWRFLGASGGEARQGGDFLEVVGALTSHSYGDEGFSVLTGEVALQGRYDLRGLSPTLRGSFVELGFGQALEAYSYEVPELALVEDTASLLLGRFGTGFYLGRGGEALVYYDHRHDDYAAGLGLTGLGGGAPGHFGVEGFVPLWGPWAVGWEAQVGSAYLGGLQVRWMGEEVVP